MVKQKFVQITVPKTIKILLCPKKNILLISGIKKEKLLKLFLKVFISKKNDKVFLLNITNIPTNQKLNNEFKKIKSLQNKLAFDIKKIFLEVSQLFYKKLNLVGVGYRILLNNIETKKFHTNFVLKLGYSHLIYYKLPSDIKIYSNKYNRMTIFGCFGYNMSQTLAKIRSLKYPEPYKGKGILYYNEKIKLKIGKRV